MKSYIIGLAGNKGCGKDTVASMINYIFAVGITKAKYFDWVLRRVSYDKTYKDRIIHFADSLKDCLSIIYNIPRQYFDDRQYKDEMYYSFITGTFINKNAVTQRGDGYYVLTNEILKHSSIRQEIEESETLHPLITIRTLMQYFGTNVCRENLGRNIWIKSAISKITDVAAGRRLCIVPDVRFTNEAAAIHRNTPSLYGRVVRITRNTDNTGERDYHDSEIIAFSTDYSITNNGTMAELFFKVLDICQKIISQ